MNRAHRKLINGLKREQAIIARSRDRLRNLVTDVEGLLDEMDVASEDLKVALPLLESALDELSKQQ